MSRRPDPSPEREGEPTPKRGQAPHDEPEIPLVVIDASALLAAFLPEENWEAEADALLDGYQEGQIQLTAPALLSSEILNSLYMAVRGKAGRPPRITEDEAQQTWTFFAGLGIPLRPVDEVASDALGLAVRREWRSVYDLVYVAWARRLETTLVSADLGLVEAFEEVQPLWEPVG